MPVTVPGVKIQAGVHSGRVFSQYSVNTTLQFEDLPPVHLSKPSKAGYPVADGHFVSRVKCLFLEDQVFQGATEFPAQPTLNDCQDGCLIVQMIQHLECEVDTGNRHLFCQIGNHLEHEVRVVSGGYHEPVCPVISQFAFP